MYSLACLVLRVASYESTLLGSSRKARQAATEAGSSTLGFSHVSRSFWSITLAKRPNISLSFLGTFLTTLAFSHRGAESPM